MLLPNSSRNRQWLPVLLALSLLSCGSPSIPESASSEAVSPPPVTSAPFDVSAVMRQVHFAYRPEGAAFRGGHSTYEVRASSDGLTLTPFLPPAEDSAREKGPRSSRARAVKGAPLTVGDVQLARGRPLPGDTAVPLRLEKGGSLSHAVPGVIDSASLGGTSRS